MTTIIDGSAGITFPNSTVQASAGSVIQVVNATYSTATSTSSTTPVTTGLTVAITPKFSNSKILVLTTFAGIYVTGSGKEGQFNLYRGASPIALIGDLYVSGANPICTQSYTYLDSPATTSSTTYTWYFFISVYSGGTVQINSSSGEISTITLLEIAA